ncbi:MAG: hypothetical protein R3D29_11960 [Nitratireductor sp.]
MSLRIEKGYGSWGREYSPEYWPQESGLDRRQGRQGLPQQGSMEKIRSNPAPRNSLDLRD